MGGSGSDLIGRGAAIVLAPGGHGACGSAGRAEAGAGRDRSERTPRGRVVHGALVLPSVTRGVSTTRRGLLRKPVAAGKICLLCLVIGSARARARVVRPLDSPLQTGVGGRCRDGKEGALRRDPRGWRNMRSAPILFVPSKGRPRIRCVRVRHLWPVWRLFGCPAQGEPAGQGGPAASAFRLPGGRADRGGQSRGVSGCARIGTRHGRPPIR